MSLVLICVLVFLLVLTRGTKICPDLSCVQVTLESLVRSTTLRTLEDFYSKGFVILSFIWKINSALICAHRSNQCRTSPTGQTGWFYL